MIERRKEIRYTIPEIYQTYMKLRIKVDTGEFLPALLVNVSLRGIKIRSFSELAVGSVTDCLISMPGSLAEEIPFSTEIHYCYEDKQSAGFLVGAEIIQTSERLWVKAFFRIHDFIDESLRVQKSFPS